MEASRRKPQIDWLSAFARLESVFGMAAALDLDAARYALSPAAIAQTLRAALAGR